MGFVIYDVKNLPDTHGGPVEIEREISARWSIGLRSVTPHVYRGQTSGTVTVYWYSGQTPSDVSAEALRTILRRLYPDVVVTVQKMMF